MRRFFVFFVVAVLVATMSAGVAQAKASRGTTSFTAAVISAHSAPMVDEPAVTAA